jgi:hypothetical protein
LFNNTAGIGAKMFVEQNLFGQNLFGQDLCSDKNRPRHVLVEAERQNVEHEIIRRQRQQQLQEEEGVYNETIKAKICFTCLPRNKIRTEA